ncbi:hypothetical protein LLG46_02360 [bacterium]|nr:hypothetical protein [bacterium]
MSNKIPIVDHPANLADTLDGDSQQIRGKYKNLGLIINGDEDGNGYQIAAGAYTTPVVVDDIGWMRFFIVFGKAKDVAGTVYFQRISPEGEVSVSEYTLGTVMNTADETWRDLASTGQNYAPWGGSAQLKVKNTGSSPGCYWLLLQLCG